MLAISINGKPVQSVVDTAAQITVISRAFADTFTPPLMGGEKVTMKGTEKVQKIPTTLKPITVRTLGLVLGTWKKTLLNGLS